MLYTFYYDEEIVYYDKKIKRKTIKVDYDKLIINNKINNIIIEYLQKNYECDDISSSFIDTKIKLKFISITKNFKDNHTEDGLIKSCETLVIILDGQRTEINFNFSYSLDWSNGMNNKKLNIEYKNKIAIEIDEKIQELIKKKCLHYENASEKQYPYYCTNLSSFENK